MVITDFTHKHIREALILAKSNYEEERRHVPVLPGRIRCVRICRGNEKEDGKCR